MNTLESQFLFFAGSSHPKLAQEVAKHLGCPLGALQLHRFPDHEISVQIQENVRGRGVFVMQTIAVHPNEYLMELLIMIDALKRASASSIVAILPYYGYCRQDRKDKPRVPITAKLVANMLVTAGATRVVTMDLHAGQLQGFFDIPVDNLFSQPLMVEAIKKRGIENLMVVVPDIGSIKLGRTFANELEVGLAIINKTRISSFEVSATHLIGDVEGKNVLLADDICSTASTLVSAAEACRKKGACKIFATITHGLFVGEAVEKIEKSPIELVFIGDTVPLSDSLLSSGKYKVVSVASLFAKAIRCILLKESISSLFHFEYD